MSDHNLEEQLQQLAPLADALFDMSTTLLQQNGNFLPHGGTLNTMGAIALASATPGTDDMEGDLTSAVEVLPVLQDGLRSETAKSTTHAVAVSENVFIGPDQTPAIKVLAEHRDGLTVAMYQTFQKTLFRGYQFHDVQIVEAAPEIGGWA